MCGYHRHPLLSLSLIGPDKTLLRRWAVPAAERPKAGLLAGYGRLVQKTSFDFVFCKHSEIMTLLMSLCIAGAPSGPREDPDGGTPWKRLYPAFLEGARRAG